MKFRKFLNESKVVIYHGDDFNTTKLEPKLMNNGNNQEGIGIYFSNKLATAEGYGKDIVSTSINTRDFIDSRVPILNINKTKIFKMLKHLHSLDNEPLYYQMTDWGIEVQEPEDITDALIKEHITNVNFEEVRNFQITLAQDYGVVNFVNAWNKYVGICGTYSKQSSTEMWYAVIDTHIKLKKV